MPNKLKTNKFKNNAEENETSQHTRVSGQSGLQVSFCNATCWMMKVRLLTSNKLINLITQQIERKNFKYIFMFSFILRSRLSCQSSRWFVVAMSSWPMMMIVNSSASHFSPSVNKQELELHFQSTPVKTSELSSLRWKLDLRIVAEKCVKQFRNDKIV